MRRVRKQTISCGTATLRLGPRGPEVLLIQPRPERDVWGFPKGHVEDGEGHEDAAVRETYEETNVEVELLALTLGEARVLLKKEDKTVIIYVAVPTDPTATPRPQPGEAHDVAWWPVTSLPDVHPSQRPLFDNLPHVARKVFSEEG